VSDQAGQGSKETGERRDGVGERFFRETRHARGRLSGGWLDWENQPPPFKTYPEAERVALPEPAPAGADLWETLTRRRSLRAFSTEPLSLHDLATLLWAGAGVSAVQAGYALRTAPSAGALYPVETYVVAHRVEGLAPGAYHYAVLERELERLSAGDLRLPVARAALDQGIAAGGAAVLLWSSIWRRSTWKYGQRAYRYVPLDAGHIAENVALAAVGLGLGTCQIAAFYDDEANALLGLDGEDESVVYMTVVGRPG
jgi:SagB-type dehydrogenase family enzyme